MNIKDLTSYQNMWIAYSKDRKRIIEKSKSLQELLKKIEGNDDLIVSFLPSSNATLSP